jgi:hypothetical protein
VTAIYSLRNWTDESEKKERCLLTENNKNRRTEQIGRSHKPFGTLYMLGGEGAGLTYLVKRLSRVWTVWSSNLGEEREFLFSVTVPVTVHTSPRTKSTYRTMDTVALFQGYTFQGVVLAIHLPSDAEGKNE